MHNKLRSMMHLIGILALFLPFGGQAAGLDGKANLVCAAVDVIACRNGPGCREGSANSFELPQFMFVDFKKQQIHGTDETGIDIFSPIKNLEITERQIILQGTGNHRGWSATINKANGKMIVSSSGSDVSFMVFGACTSK